MLSRRCQATFLIVFCYKYNMMRLLKAFIGASIVIGLGVMSFVMWAEAVQKYEIVVDWATTTCRLFTD